jgi:Ser/Thr protein kinase RdoA (MazF antagonist)
VGVQAIPLTDAALVGRILRDYRLDEAGPAGVRRAYGSVSGARVGFLITPPRGTWMLVRAFRSDEPLPAYLQGCGTASVTEWLYDRAAMLEWLAFRGYPAPRTVPTRTGEQVGVAGIWLTWATTYVAGPPLVPGRGGLDLLGEALARLHALGAPDAARSSSYPDAVIGATLRRLAAVEPVLPAEWRQMHEEFRGALLELRRAALPVTMVHGGAWPENVIRTGPAQVTLIDWENAGPGLAVADLGHCLLECHLDPGLPTDQPAAWQIRPERARIAALLTGYSRLRRLDSSEREFLLPGIRFATAVAGALHFEQALVDGVRGAGMDARLGRLRNRLEVSRAVAELAMRHLDEPPTRYAEPGSPVAEDTGA